MNKAISTWSFPAASSLAERLRLARAAGFAGFEIDLSEDGPVSLQSTGDELRGVRAEVEGAGLELSGLATGLYWGAYPASADACVRERAAHILRRREL